jgi:hypothetical protein
MTSAPFATLMADAMDTLKETYAETVTYHPKVGRSYEINAIFDESHSVIDTSGAVPFEGVKPVLSIATRDLRESNRAMPKRGDEITIRGKKYNIAEIMPDGIAEVRLVLSLGVTRA